MWQHEPLKLVLAVGCKFSIHTKLDILPTCMLVHPRSPDHTQTSGVSTPKSSLAVIQIWMWQKCTLTPFHPHTPFSFPRKKAQRGDMAFAQGSSWHGGSIRWEVNEFRCTWELANVPRSRSAEHAEQRHTVSLAWSSHKVKRQMPILSHSNKDKGRKLWYFWNKTGKRKLLKALTLYWKSLTCWLLKFLFKFPLSHTNAGMIPTYYSAPVKM